MDKTFEFQNETRKHIGMVSNFINSIVTELLARSVSHDHSKLEEPEYSLFEAHTSIYKNASTGSDEQKNALAAMKPAFDHHLKVNKHHPEYFVINNKDVKLEQAISQLSIIDMVQMLCDWIATSKRQNYNTYDFINNMCKKYNVNEQLANIFKNTIPTIEQYVNNIEVRELLIQEDETFAMNNNIINHFDANGKLINVEKLQ